MNCKAVLSNKAHPEYGQVTILFPIPDSEYDITISLLEDLDIGSPTAQNCMVNKVDSPYPILNRLVAQSVNVDELNFVRASFISLASTFGESSLIPLLLLSKSKPLRWVSIWLPRKRLEGFCPSEAAQFQAMASKLCLSDIKDLINLTFCCQQTTVITDFSDLKRVGKEHSLAINGGTMPSAEYDQVGWERWRSNLIFGKTRLRRESARCLSGCVFRNHARVIRAGAIRGWRQFCAHPGRGRPCQKAGGVPPAR